ncbi:MAG: YqhA family protein [Bacteroidales bacterium]|jgi:uncharacterized membrane protein YqhA|nr:YqhA family protein [Bacteroidales bacterium]
MSKKINKIIESIFESFLFNSRFVVILAVLGSLTASVVLFVTSTIEIAEGISERVSEQKIVIVEGVSTFVNETKSDTKLLEILVSSVDEYLFATVLFIFSMGLYELFIRKISIENQQKKTQRNWLKINSIEDLKNMLGKVIMMVLVVSFFQYSLHLKYDQPLDLLYFGLGILFVSLALYLSHSFHKHKDNQENNTLNN